jgi:hypothetical protein
MLGQYNGGLTREQFLFFETKTLAKLLHKGESIDEAIYHIKQENLFQFPTERMIESIAQSCYRRLQALESDKLIEVIATSSVDVAKQVNLYAMMKQNRIVWDFMTTVIGEKFRTQDFSFSKKDTNVFMFQLQEQNEDVADWSDSTIQKIKQVLTKILVECGYLDNTKSEVLNPVYIYPELEEEIRDKNDLAALPAFNFFA